MSETPLHAWPHPDLGGYVLGALTAEEAVDFEAHLAGCAACRASVADLDGMRDAVRIARESPAYEMSPGLRARTFAAVERAATAERRHRRLRVVAAAAALTAVAGGTAVGLAAAGVFSSGARPETTLALAAPPGSGGHGTGSAQLFRALGGIRVVLAVQRLKPSAPGTFYECFFVGPHDTLAHQDRVAVGSFVVGSSGSARVTMTTAADLHQFPVMGITLEPDDGNPLRTGPKVLVSVPH